MDPSKGTSKLSGLKLLRTCVCVTCLRSEAALGCVLGPAFGKNACERGSVGMWIRPIVIKELQAGSSPWGLTRVWAWTFVNQILSPLAHRKLPTRSPFWRNSLMSEGPVAAALWSLKFVAAHFSDLSSQSFGDSSFLFLAWS